MTLHLTQKSHIIYSFLIPKLKDGRRPIPSLSLRHFASSPNGRLIFERIFLAEDNRGGNFHLSSAYSSCSAFQREKRKSREKAFIITIIIFILTLTLWKKWKGQIHKMIIFFFIKSGHICSFFAEKATKERNFRIILIRSYLNSS